jgi:hypothetical protein
MLHHPLLILPTSALEGGYREVLQAVFIDSAKPTQLIRSSPYRILKSYRGGIFFLCHYILFPFVSFKKLAAFTGGELKNIFNRNALSCAK